MHLSPLHIFLFFVYRFNRLLPLLWRIKISKTTGSVSQSLPKSNRLHKLRQNQFITFSVIYRTDKQTDVKTSPVCQQRNRGCLGRVGSCDSRRSDEFFGGRERWRTDSAKNLRRKAFGSCKLFVYIWLLGALPLNPHWGSAPRPRWETSVPRPSVPTLTSEPGYTIVVCVPLQWHRNILFQRRLFNVYDFFQFSTESRNLRTTAMCSRVMYSLNSLLKTRSKFIDNPLTYTELHRLTRICEHWTFLCLTEKKQRKTEKKRTSASSLSNDLLNLWNISDLILNSSAFEKYREDFSRYNSCLQFAQEIYSFRSKNKLHVSKVVQNNEHRIALICLRQLHCGPLFFPLSLLPASTNCHSFGRHTLEEICNKNIYNYPHLARFVLLYYFVLPGRRRRRRQQQQQQ